MKNLLLFWLSRMMAVRVPIVCSNQPGRRRLPPQRQEQRKRKKHCLTTTTRTTTTTSLFAAVVVALVATYCCCCGSGSGYDSNVVHAFSLQHRQLDAASQRHSSPRRLTVTTALFSSSQEEEEEGAGAATTTTIASKKTAAAHDNNDDNNNNRKDNMEQQIATWRQAAVTARQEAAEMERKLTLEKIAKLKAALAAATAAAAAAATEQQPNKNTTAARKYDVSLVKDKSSSNRTTTTTTTLWTEHDRQEAQKTLRQLQQKLEATAAASATASDETSTRNGRHSSTSSSSATTTAVTAKASATPSAVPSKQLTLDTLTPSNNNNNNKYIQTGYSKEDLALYLPVALEIQERFQQNATTPATNTTTTTAAAAATWSSSTIQDQLAAFRSDPRTQKHFQQKIQQLLVEPLQNLQKLEALRKQYLASSSIVEKKQMKREMAYLQKVVDGRKASSGIADNDETKDDYDEMNNLLSILPPPLNDLDERLADLEYLPVVLQAMYLQRVGLPLDGDDSSSSMAMANNDSRKLALAIQLEYYNDVVEALLYRIPDDEDDDMETRQQIRHQVTQIVQALPQPLQVHLARKVGMYDLKNDRGNGLNANDSGRQDEVDLNVLVDKLLAPDDKRRRDLLRKGWKQEKYPSEVDDNIMVTVDAPDFLEDIDYIDRSRYIAELYPALGRLEDYHPTERELGTFTKEILFKKPMLFQVSEKPDRVMGGYYVRGYNRIANDNSGVELTARLQHRLENSSTLKDNFDFYYVMDPSPMSDESYEMGYENEPVLFVSSKNATAMYNLSPLPTKLFVSTLSIVSVWLFALASCDMQPVLQERISTVIEMGTSNDDLAWLVDIAFQISLSILAIQLAHEMAHRVVAWRDKVCALRRWKNMTEILL